MSEAIRALVERHATALEDVGKAMAADGIGLADGRGHVAVARRMASDLRAQAAQGRLAHSFPSGDGRDGYYAGAAPGPVRHALTAAGLGRLAAAGEVISVDDLAASFTSAGTSPGDRIMLKQHLARSGQLTP